MAIGNLGQGVTSSSVPLPVTTASATTSATTTDVTVTWTPDTKGAVPTAYTVTGTASGGFTTTATTTATSVTLSRQNGGRAYTFAVASQNRFGSSTANASAVTPPFVYKEAITATSTVNYTIPTGYSKMAAIVYGGGGNGQAASGNSGANSGGGKGGAGAGAVAFQEYSITQDQVYTLTVAAASGQSKITAVTGSVIIASANGGAQGGFGSGTNAGGTATSQVATNATITGGTGGGGSSGLNGSNTAGQAGGSASASTFTVLTGYNLPNPVAMNLNGGGGGGSGFQVTDYRYGAGFGSNQAGGAATNGGVTGVTGGYGGSGSGGAGGGFAAGVNQAGGVGRVVVYVA
jgi:hypothetical protein